MIYTLWDEFKPADSRSNTPDAVASAAQGPAINSRAQQPLSSVAKPVVESTKVEGAKSNAKTPQTDVSPADEQAKGAETATQAAGTGDPGVNAWQNRPQCSLFNLTSPGPGPKSDRRGPAHGCPSGLNRLCQSGTLGLTSNQYWA